jgi:hypothetical protein
MRVLQLTAQYRSPADLAHHIRDLQGTRAMLLPLDLGDMGPSIQQFQPISLEIALPQDKVQVAGEILQIMPAVGLVVQLQNPEAVFPLTQGSEPSPSAEPPRVSLSPMDTEAAAPPQPKPPCLNGPEIEDKAVGEKGALGLSYLAWPLDKLQREWDRFSLPEKMRLAKYGSRAVRGMIMRLNDHALDNVLMQNPHIGAEEVAALVSKVNLDSTLLKRIATSEDWKRHPSVARNLLCHPKLPMPLVEKVMPQVPLQDLRRFARTGKVRASVKALIIKYLERYGH